MDDLLDLLVGSLTIYSVPQRAICGGEGPSTALQGAAWCWGVLESAGGRWVALIGPDLVLHWALV